MDLQGSLVDTNLRIYPSNSLLNFIKTLNIDDNVPENIIKLVKGKNYEVNRKVINDDAKTIPIYLDSKDIDNIQKIKSVVNKDEEIENEEFVNLTEEDQKVKDKESKTASEIDSNEVKANSKNSLSNKSKLKKDDCNEKTKESKKNDKEHENNNEEDKLHLITSDIDWLYAHFQKLKSKGVKNVPYLYTLLEGAQIETPQNKVLKRNPVLEARCVKLRAQQEAREYRKMTKSVDNVRMRFPEDSISYQCKCNPIYFYDTV